MSLDTRIDLAWWLISFCTGPGWAQPSHGETTHTRDGPLAKLSARIKSRVDEVERKFNSVVAKTKERAINFSGLGFQTIAESNVWLETSLRKHQSGLIVDAYMVFEHAYHTIEGIDTIATMENLYKIKVLCITNSVAMTSFDAKMPKYFSRIQGH
jgi:uncharacterized protein YlxP (DUF503 family)